MRLRPTITSTNASRVFSPVDVGEWFPPLRTGYQFWQFLGPDLFFMVKVITLLGRMLMQAPMCGLVQAMTFRIALAVADDITGP